MIPVVLPLSPLAREGSLALVSRAQKDAELALLTCAGFDKIDIDHRISTPKSQCRLPKFELSPLLREYFGRPWAVR